MAQPQLQILPLPSAPPAAVAPLAAQRAPVAAAPLQPAWSPQVQQQRPPMPAGGYAPGAAGQSMAQRQAPLPGMAPAAGQAQPGGVAGGSGRRVVGGTPGLAAAQLQPVAMQQPQRAPSPAGALAGAGAAPVQPKPGQNVTVKELLEYILPRLDPDKRRMMLEAQAEWKARTDGQTDGPTGPESTGADWRGNGQRAEALSRSLC
jgi:hypothetical protein